MLQGVVEAGVTLQVGYATWPFYLQGEAEVALRTKMQRPLALDRYVSDHPLLRRLLVAEVALLRVKMQRPPVRGACG